eukprot:scaffold16087_cov112-Isochrysis_galbana.AAC.7
MTGELSSTRYASAGGAADEVVPTKSRGSTNKRLRVAGWRWRTRAAQEKPRGSCGAPEKQNERRAPAVGAKVSQRQRE